MHSKFTFDVINNASVSVSVYYDNTYKCDIQCIADNNLAKTTGVIFRNCKLTFYIDFHGHLIILLKLKEHTKRLYLINHMEYDRVLLIN